MSRTRRWRSSFGYIESELGDVNKLSLVGCCSFFIHWSTLSFLRQTASFIYLYPWLNEPAFIRESSSSYTQTRGNQPDAQQSEAEFQLQIIIWANFPGFHRERRLLTNLNRPKLQKTWANLRKISLQYSWSLTAAQAHCLVISPANFCSQSSIKRLETPQECPTEPAKTILAVQFSFLCLGVLELPSAGACRTCDRLH